MIYYIVNITNYYTKIYQFFQWGKHYAYRFYAFNILEKSRWENISNKTGRSISLGAKNPLGTFTCKKIGQGWCQSYSTTFEQKSLSDAGRLYAFKEDYLISMHNNINTKYCFWESQLLKIWEARGQIKIKISTKIFGEGEEMLKIKKFIE